jgi:hypothetical protein
MSWPIENLVTQRCRELGLSRTELVVRCGYKNTSKGLRRLDQVNTGDLEKAVFLLRGLPKALQLSPEIVQGAVDETIRQIAAEADARYRASFEPHGYLLGTSEFANLHFRPHRWPRKMAENTSRPLTAAPELCRASPIGGAENASRTILWPHNRIHCELHPGPRGPLRP